MLSEQWSRLLSIARYEWHWIAGGLVALCLRLPFNLAMPHYISVAISDTLEAVHTGDMSILDDVKVSVIRFFAVALANAALDFFNWNFFVIAQQRVIRRCVSPLSVRLLT